MVDDFNIEPADKKFNAFCESHEFITLLRVRHASSQVVVHVLTLISLIRNSFKNTNLIETGLSDFHRMIFTQMKLTFEISPPRTISFRDFKPKFVDDLHKALICNLQTSHDFGQFLQVFDNVLDKHAPLKKRFARGNQKPFMNKWLSGMQLCIDQNCSMLSIEQRNYRTGKTIANKEITVLS